MLSLVFYFRMLSSKVCTDLESKDFDAIVLVAPNTKVRNLRKSCRGVLLSNIYDIYMIYA